MIVNNCCVYEFVDRRPSPPVDFLLPLSILPGKSGTVYTCLNRWVLNNCCIFMLSTVDLALL